MSYRQCYITSSIDESSYIGQFLFLPSDAAVVGKDIRLVGGEYRQVWIVKWASTEEFSEEQVNRYSETSHLAGKRIR